MTVTKLRPADAADMIQVKSGYRSKWRGTGPVYVAVASLPGIWAFSAETPVTPTRLLGVVSCGLLGCCDPRWQLMEGLARVHLNVSQTGGHEGCEIETDQS